MKPSKTTYIIKRVMIWNNPAPDVPGYIVYRKTGLFSKEYIGHAINLYNAELLTGKHKTITWDLHNKIILKILNI